MSNLELNLPMANSQKTLLTRNSLHSCQQSVRSSESSKHLQHIYVHASPDDAQSSNAKLTCSSTAAWPSPMLLPNSKSSSTAPACPIPCPRACPRQATRASPDCCNAAQVAKPICAVYFLSAALSKCSAELHCSHRTLFKRRSRSRYLQLSACADGTRPRQVGICSARDEGQAGSVYAGSPIMREQFNK